MQSYAPSGVNQIVDFFKKIKHENIEMKYLGAGKYNLRIIATDYDFAEGLFETHIIKPVEEFKENGGIAEFARN